MAARLNPRNSEYARAKIRTTQLINRLSNHALGKLKREMNDSQVRAALGLLKKTLPDISTIEHLGEIQTTLSVISAEPLSAEAWAKQYGKK